MAYRNRFTTSDLVWSIEAATENDSVQIQGGIPDQGTGPNGVGEARPATMGTWSSLQTLLDATPDGGSLDLRGQGFEPEDNTDPFPTNNNKDLIVVGGYLTAAKALSSWTDLGGGVYSSDINLSWLDDMRNYLVDADQDDAPALKVYPAVPSGYGNNRFSVNANWLKINSINAGINNGVANIYIEKYGDVTNQVLSGPDTTSDTYPWTYVDEDGDTVGVASKITGFTITDPTLRDEVTARVNAVGLSSIGINIHSGPNVTAFSLPDTWDPVTGVMTFAEDFGIGYNGYISFCMYGGQDLASGEYSIDINNNTIYYNPVSGDPTNASMPLRPHIFQVSSGGQADIQFYGTTFIGGSQGTHNASLLSAGTDGTRKSTLKNCSFSFGKYACYGTANDVERCTFDRMESSAIITGPGCRIVNSTFTGMENKSAISNMGDQVGTTVIEPSLISGCYFNLPTTGHGQGISLYQDSWINATVENCIFFNCARAMSFQPYKSDPHTTTGSMKFNNNLIVTNATVQPNNEVLSGQTVLAFNGAVDVALNASQLVEFRHNTLFADETTLTGSVSTSFSSIMSNLINSSLTLESNVAGRMMTAFESSGGLGGPSKRFANLFLPINGSSIGTTSWGSTDLPFFNTTSDVFDRLTLTTQGVATTAAADGGSIGVRWSSIPTQAELENITVDWTDTHIPQTLPRATSYSTAWGGDNTPPS